MLRIVDAGGLCPRRSAGHRVALCRIPAAVADGPGPALCGCMVSGTRETAADSGEQVAQSRSHVALDCSRSTDRFVCRRAALGLTAQGSSCPVDDQKSVRAGPLGVPPVSPLLTMSMDHVFRAGSA